MLPFGTSIAVPTWVLLASLLCAWTYWLVVVKQRRIPPLPSPPGDPILGHLRYMPNMNDRDTVFHEWGRKYGDIFMIHILGKIIVVINGEKVAHELMEKRSAIYSDRPFFPLMERVGWKDGTLIARYGPGWTTQRRMMQRPMAKTMIPEYRNIQEQETDILLRGLSEQPEKYTEFLRRYTAGILVPIIYGHRIRSLDDEWYRLAKTVDEFHPSLLPSLMDISPYFEYLPSWFPGVWFKDYIRETKPIIQSMMRVPLKRVWKEVLSGTVPEPSFASRNLEAMQKDGVISDKDWWNIEMTCSQLFSAGLDTSYQTSHWFIVCMLLHPEVQAKAQREIDSVVGRDRLPSSDDRDSLPYVQCVMNEVMRCQLVVPLGVPHKSTSEDVYEGMRIPKGATIIVNSRGITLDENNFHSPHEFKPERFLPKPEGAGETFSMNSIFGWGRRICPGRHLADANTWLLIARVLATFTITKAKDANGELIEPDLRWDTGLVRYPEPFAFDIHPRDDKASSLIKNINLNE